ncbi:MAG: dihydrolipoyl dehydrogenase [Clostridia bacterium]|nr:dihydrolipoyl dehydrogenase [Clostridia bacterium]MDD4798480.1 dihydrolipoyl dehydrogenase [Clostridia bacterium]
MEIKMPLLPGGKMGTVGKINVKVGEIVAEKDELAQVETGKGNKTIKAPAGGKICKICVCEGQKIASDELMFEISEAEANCPEANCQCACQEKQSENITTDLCVIGGGPGGYVAAIYAAKQGLKVTLIEKGALGGTCLNVGCIPTKAFVKSSEVCRTIKEAPVFGIYPQGDFKVDMEKIVAHKDEVRATLVGGIEYLMNKNKIQVIKGAARFADQNTVIVEAEKTYVIKAKDYIVSTGSKTSKIPICGIDLPFVMDSTAALSCSELPKSITIIGGGVIGMEFAFIYRNLGVQVNVIEFLDKLLTMLDSDISSEILQIASEAGIKIRLSSKVTKIQPAINDQAVVTFEKDGKEEIVVSDKVLVAIGREPNLEGLDSEKAGLEKGPRNKGLQVDEGMRTNVEHIYAVGDVTNIIQLAHIASRQGLVAVDNILGKNCQMDYHAVPNVIFTSPEIASVGLNEDECQARKLDYVAARSGFAANGKALTMNETKGYVKLIKDAKTNKIIGGSVIGVDASTLIAALAIAVQNGLTEENLTETIFAHPTVGETIYEAALGLGIGALHE